MRVVTPCDRAARASSGQVGAAARRRATVSLVGMSHPLVTVTELASTLERGGVVRLLDVRWRLDRPDGRPAHREGHLPGAVYVDLDAELARHGDPIDGRHPLPDRADLQAAARRWGVDDGDAVVVYDDLGGQSAARAWWLLRASGLADVRLLDGGLSAWREAGLPLEQGDVVARPGGVTLGDDPWPVIDADEAAAWPRTGVLVDSRAAERYRGDVEPVDPRAGHVPGAVNLPTAGNLDQSGRFVDAARLRARFEEAGVGPSTPVAVYCGSGITAAHNALAATIAGFEPVLFAGSWSAWSNDPTRPLATGDGPG